MGEHPTTEQKVTAVTALYNNYSIKELSNTEMEKYLAKAYQALDALGVDENRKTQLRELTKQIMERES